MTRRYVFGGIILVVLVFGFLLYQRLRPAPAAQQGDPAIALAIALAALERTPENALTADQVKTMLPYLRVLRDTDPADLDASRALAEQIRTLLTPQQQAAIARMREEAQGQQGRFSRGGPGDPGRFGGPGRPGVPGGPGAVGGPSRPGGPAGGRAELRREILTRLIQRLQSQFPQS